MRTPPVSAVLALALMAGCLAPGDDDDSATQPTGRSTLDCPEPGGLPFTTQTTSWTAPGTQEVFMDTVPGYGGLDALGPLEATATITGVMARNDGFLAAPIVGEWVSAWAFDDVGGWYELGRAQTDFDQGRYVLDVARGAVPPGDARFYGVLEGARHCVDHGVFTWPPGTRVIVTDIDGTLTLSDDELSAQLSDYDYVQQAWPGAVELTTTWQGKGYGVVYLTARTDELRSITRPWLDATGFAYGPLSTSPELVLGGTAAAYKAGFLRRLLDDLEWDIVAVYGNASSDIEAYAEVGIPLDRTFIIGENGGEGGTVAVQGGWEQHIDELVVPYEETD